MSLFSLLRKPAWEHRDASRRAAAVASETHPDLLAKLPDLARSDADAGVRLAAVRRVEDLSLLGDRMRNDADAGVRNLARQRYLQRLLDARVPQAERERVMAVEEDSEILATLAQQAPEAALRRLCLERINRPGLLLERCVKDPDPDVRRWLLDRIDDVPSLERIAERARKTDKHLARTARERAFAARLAAGDPAAIQQRALSLCDELDALRRQLAPDTARQRDGLASEWQSLKPRLDAAMVRRVEGYFTALENALNPPPPAPAPEPQQVEALPSEVQPSEAASITPPAAVVRESDAGLMALATEIQARAERLSLRDLEALEKRWQARQRQIEPLLPEEQEYASRFHSTASALHKKFEEHSRRCRAALETLPVRVGKLEAAVAAGHLAEAHSLQRGIDADRNLLRDQFPRSLARRVNDAQRELDTLSRYQRWSGNQARMRLIDDVEALAGSGLHPDAVASKVRDLQSEWQQLDSTEARGPDSPEHPLSRRFRAACHRILAPARPYFEKRRELRGAQREEIETFINALETRLGQPQNIRALFDARRQINEQLHLTSSLDPAARRELSKRLRDLREQLSARITEQETDAQEQKQKLLANLRRDLMHAELASALPLARQAQAAWKNLPRAGRKAEDALWKELRELIDPWFNQADEKQRERAEAEAATAAEARSILDELAQLANDTAALAQAESRLANLHSRWRALGETAPDDTLPPAREKPLTRPPRHPARPALDERAFDRAVADVRAACARLAEAARREELATLLQALDYCDQLEALPADAESQRAELLAQLQALPLPNDARACCQQRQLAQAQPLSDDEQSPEQRAEALTVLAELASGLDSPPEARELRRRLQIERLSEHLSGAAPTGNDTLRSLLLDYLKLGNVPASTRSALAARWKAVATKAV